MTLRWCSKTAILDNSSNEPSEGSCYFAAGSKRRNRCLSVATHRCPNGLQNNKRDKQRAVCMLGEGRGQAQRDQLGVAPARMNCPNGSRGESYLPQHVSETSGSAKVTSPNYDTLQERLPCLST